MLASFPQLISDLIAPRLCPLCKNDTFNGDDGLCNKCLDEMPLLPERRCPGCGGPNNGFLDLCRDCLSVKGGRPWRIGVTAFPFSGVARDAVHLYKYRSRTSLAPFFAKVMVESWKKAALGIEVDAVTYIPLHLFRYIWRGYNQASILSDYIGDCLGVPSYRTLIRTRNTAQQASLGLSKRQSNTSGAFRIFSKRRIENKRLLLVDDVFTTGSTLTAGVNVLLKAGAAEVSVITVARD